MNKKTLALVIALLLNGCGGEETCVDKKRSYETFKKNAKEYEDVNVKIANTVGGENKISDIVELRNLFDECEKNIRNVESISVKSGFQKEIKDNYIKSLKHTCQKIQIEITDLDKNVDGLKKAQLRMEWIDGMTAAFINNPYHINFTCGESVMQQSKLSNTENKAEVNLNSNDQQKIEIAKKIKFKKGDWNTGYGSSFALNAIIVNENEFAVKDIGIGCLTYGKSGTKLNQVEQTVYEVIGPNKQLKINNFFMGSINSQSNNAKCIVFSAVKVD